MSLKYNFFFNISGIFQSVLWLEKSKRKDREREREVFLLEAVLIG